MRIVSHINVLNPNGPSNDVREYLNLPQLNLTKQFPIHTEIRSDPKKLGSERQLMTEDLNKNLQNSAEESPSEADRAEVQKDITSDTFEPQSQTNSSDEAVENDNETPNDIQPVEKKKKRGSIIKESVEYAEIFVLAICFVVILFSFCFRLCTVDGASMENTLYEGESLIVSNLFYKPEAGDIIVFHQTGELNEPVVKRVIAVEGEKVHVVYFKDYMTITVTDADGNERTLEESYMKYEGPLLYMTETEYTVPENCLFVLGDNRNNSKDSRHPHIGMVDERRVLGKVVLRLKPLDRLGFVN